jgi:tetratricopeptide (TPR) repeat protein
MKGRYLHAVLLSGLVLGSLALFIHPNQREGRKTVVAKRAAPAATPAEISSAISGLELGYAERLLNDAPLNPAEASVLRARFALYRGDCDEARAVLALSNALEVPVIRELSQLAEGCARAVAGAKIITDDSRGVWVRVQDDADAVWANLIADVAVRARDATGAELGIHLPRPLRIELVMDHASLSAMTGLPLEAAETTGTVAVARWGRVTMLSPRSFAKGYPWQDTLAHEITHLLVTAATRDNASLWLQEALAKHFETRWRDPRPLDDVPNQHELTHLAWLQGRSVGIENLGASIALLPSPESARIAYAEVADFLDFILHESGWPALRLLLRDLRELGIDGTNKALVSVTGYSQTDWIRRWQSALSRESVTKKSTDEPSPSLALEGEIERAQRLRLAELLTSRKAYAAALQILSQDHIADSNLPELRAIAGLATLQSAAPDKALDLMGSPTGLLGLSGNWLAIRGRALNELGRTAEAETQFNWALAFAPTDERVCCEGRSQSDGLAEKLSSLSVGSVRRPLCLAARGLAASAGQPPMD